jgi:hypothetical protein
LARRFATGLYALRSPNPLRGFGHPVTIPRALLALLASGNLVCLLEV